MPSCEKTARQDCARGQEKTAAFPVLPFDFQGGIGQLLLTYTFFKESKEILSNLRNFFQSSKEICGTGSESPALERVDKWYLRVMTGGQAEGFPLGVATMAWRVGKVVGA